MRTLLVVLSLLIPAAAAADGIVVYHSEVGAADVLQVEAEAQRAALWYRDYAWELTIQPRFPRAAGRAAWLVPFPVAPSVTEASPDFLDSLELLTVPLFIPYCLEPQAGGLFGCMGSAAGGMDEGRTGDGESGVTIWGQGETKALEWVVLEAPGAAAVLDWLDGEGYRVPDLLKASPQVLEGQVVFAAKLKPGMDPDEALPPMTFRLPELSYLHGAAYPLRLTAAVAPDAGTELLLWLITPQSEDEYGAMVPASHHWLAHRADGQTPTQWDADQALVRSAFPPEGGLILEYFGIPGEQNLYRGYPLVPPGGWTEVMPADVGLDLPETWPEEIQAIGAERYRVARFHGQLTAAAMDRDLSFETVPPGQVDDVDNLIWRKVSCKSIDGDEETARVPLGPMTVAAALALVALLSLALLRRLRP